MFLSFICLSTAQQKYIFLKETNTSKTISLDEQLVIKSERFYNRIESALSHKNIFVLDQGNYKIHIFDRNGCFLKSFGNEGNGPSEFSAPYKIYFHQNTKFILVCDIGRLLVFTEKGNFLRDIKALGEAVFFSDKIVFRSYNNLTSFGYDGNKVAEQVYQEENLSDANSAAEHFKRQWNNPQSVQSYKDKIIYNRSGEYQLVLANSRFETETVLKRSFSRIKINYEKDFGFDEKKSNPKAFVKLINAIKTLTRGYNSDIESVLGFYKNLLVLKTAEHKSSVLEFDFVNLKKNTYQHIILGKKDELISASVREGMLLLNLKNDIDGPYLKLYKIEQKEKNNSSGTKVLACS